MKHIGRIPDRVLHLLAAGAATLLFSIPIAPSADAFQSINPGRALPADTRDKELITGLGTGFRSLSTPHFTILSDTDPSDAGRLAETAESTCDRVVEFARRLKISPGPIETRMTVVFFDVWQEYENFARAREFAVDERVPGFFDERGRRCCIFNYANAALIRKKRDELLVARAELFPSSATSRTSDAAVQQVRDEKLRRIRDIELQIDRHMALINATVIRHEIAHQVLLAMGIQRADDANRRWLKEGLAMQFETIEQPNPHRLADFRAINWDRGGLRLAAIVADPRQIGPGAANAQQAYAAAWALVRYLAEVHPESLAKYLASTPGGANESSFEKAFFFSPDEAFSKRLHAFFDDRRAPGH